MRAVINFNIFTSGFCMAGCIYNISLQRANLAVLTGFLSAANLFVAWLNSKRMR